MPKTGDELLSLKLRDVEKAQNRVRETVDALHEEISAALSEKRITPKEAARLRAGFKGK